MRVLDMEPTPEELSRTFEKLRESLRPQILAELHNGNFRDTMIEEYRTLATTASDLLNLLRSTGFAEVLAFEEASTYENILARFSTSGQRCRMLIEESANMEEQAMLAIAPTPSGSLN